MLMIFFLILNHRHSHTCIHVHTNILLHSYLTTSLSGRWSWRYSNARRINKIKKKLMTFSCAGIQISDPRLEMKIFIHTYIFNFFYFSLKRNITSDREAIRGRDSILGLHKKDTRPTTTGFMMTTDVFYIIQGSALLLRWYKILLAYFWIWHTHQILCNIACTLENTHKTHKTTYKIWVLFKIKIRENSVLSSKITLTKNCRWR